MLTPADRLRQAREEAGYATPADAARAMGVSEPTYYAHENGSRGLPRAATRYAKFFRVSLDWLLNGRGASVSRPRQVPIVGYVGAGSEVQAIDNHGPGDGFDHVEAPVDCSADCKAVEIRGTSMRPAFEEGDILIYDDQSTDAAMMLNKRCVVKLADGRIFVKRLRRGTQYGLWSLESFNADLIEDVAVDWVAKIKAILPR